MHSPIVGNKDDDPERKVVEREDAMKFAEQMGIQVFETSAKDNKNVEEVAIICLFFNPSTSISKYKFSFVVPIHFL